ncbi:MAG: hypothetical protein IT256_06885 [Chitinophagaceae bacterium]|nr:hypothetical protein [Chitinophagaceae bacterium]
MQRLFFATSYIIMFLVLAILALGTLYILRYYQPRTPMLPAVKAYDFKGLYTPTISRPKLVAAIIDWCIMHIGDQHTQPTVQISYHPHRQNYGCYLIDKKLIRIYIKNHKSTESLVLTIIHEFVHFTELQTTRHSNNYILYDKKYGYHTNPYERSANDMAARHYQQCLQDLSALGYLKAQLPLF